MLWDTHLHTRYSGDSTAEPEDMVQAALQHGLDGICFTDHIDYDYPKEPELFLFDMDAYQKELSELKEKYDKQSSCKGVMGIILFFCFASQWSESLHLSVLQDAHIL